VLDKREDIASTLPEGIVEKLQSVKDNTSIELESSVDLLKELWATKEIKDVWEIIKFQSSYPHAGFYLDEVDRILAEDYVPTHDDIVRSRQATIGASTSHFWANHHWWSIVDVGGHTPERPKWAPIIKEGINSVIYFVALDDYDTESGEEIGKTKMDVSMLVFEEIINCDLFGDETCTLIFFNKFDLFQEMLLSEDHFKKFKEKFPEYKGEQKVDECLDYLKQLFLGLSQKRESKDIYCHETTAIDTNQIQKIWGFMRESIFKARSAKSELLNF